jgi:phosphonopyruvate decarboxylase
LKGLTDALDQKEEIAHHVAANEGIALAIAAGYHLASNKIPVVYLQNSGLGNLLNPFMSLVHEEVFAIPILFLVGWRGMPGAKDEPQHLPQGASTEDLLNIMGLRYQIMDSHESYKVGINIQEKNQKSIALLFPPDLLKPVNQTDDFKLVNSEISMSRERAIEITLDFLNSSDIIITTTGKASRETYKLIHSKDLDRNLFMNIGSMGYASSIGYGVALSNINKRIVVFDGDGAFQMHLGAICNLSNLRNQSFIHILLVNGTHSSVAGSRVSKPDLNYTLLFEVFDYENRFEISNEQDLRNILNQIDNLNGLISIVINVNNKETDLLGRPNESPLQQKKIFTKRIR